MEFADPVVAENELKNNEEEDVRASKSPKTEETIQKLEDDIENIYSLIENRFSTLWNNASKSAHEIQDKVNLDQRKKDLMELLNHTRDTLSKSSAMQGNLQLVEEQLKDIGQQARSLESAVNFESISSLANKALDSLDSKLEIVEHQAGKIMSQFSSFFSNIVSIDNNDTTETNEIEKKQPVFPNAAYGTTRYDAELFQLHTNEEAILEDIHDSSPEIELFDVEAKTKEIASLLSRYPETLEELMNSVVPLKISYKVFWYRYFKLESELRFNEEKRKELLTRKVDTGENSLENAEDGDNDEEEEFTWDDEDEEEVID